MFADAEGAPHGPGKSPQRDRRKVGIPSAAYRCAQKRAPNGPRWEAKSRLGWAPLMSDPMLSSGGSMTSKTEMPSIVRSVEDIQQSAAHGPGEAVGVTMILSCNPGWWPGMQARTQKGRFTGQQRPLRLSLQHATSPTATSRIRACLVSSPLATLTATSLP